MQEHRRRTLLKTLIWRLSATAATVAIVLAFTGEVVLSVGIGFVEVFTKTALYYLHERFWDRIAWGRASLLGRIGGR